CVFFFCLVLFLPSYPLFPYTTLFRSCSRRERDGAPGRPTTASCRASPRTARRAVRCRPRGTLRRARAVPRCRTPRARARRRDGRSEEHTSELQSQSNLVCRLLLEKKK